MVPFRSSAAAGGRRGNGASGLSSPGVFFCGPRVGRSGMSESKRRALPRERAGERADAREALEWARETQAQMVDLKFCDLLGTWQHMTLPIRAFDESAFDEGLGFDGSSIRGWQGISESDMLLMPDADDRDPRPVHRGADALAHLRDRRPGHARAVRTGPAPGRAEGRGVPALDRHRGHRVLRARSASSSSSTRSRTTLGPNRAHYEVDSAEGHWNSGKPGPRLHGAREGGLLPAGAARHAARPPHARWC